MTAATASVSDIPPIYGRAADDITIGMLAMGARNFRPAMGWNRIC
jgi:hypothetical protein